MAVKRSIITPIAVAVALATTLSLSGCFSNPLDKLASGGADKLVEQVTGGKVGSSIGKLPKDFPKNIPMVSGKVIHSMSVKADDGKMWTVQIRVGGSKEKTSASVQKKLEDAGWEQQLWNEGDSMTMGMYADKGRNISATVSITDADDEGGLMVQYGVIKSEKSD